MNKLQTIFLFLFPFLLTGCISITKELPPFTTYTLSLEKETKLPQSKEITTDFSLEINEPKALSSVNSKLISYLKPTHQNETYALNKWSDSPTKLLQNIMVQSLHKSQSYKFVTSSKLNINTTHKIISELDSFGQIFVGNKSYAQLKIRVYLVDYQNVYDKVFTYKEKCEQNNALGSVKALNEVTNLFVKDLHLWIQEVL